MGISNQLERHHQKLCPSRGKTQYELMTLERNTFFSFITWIAKKRGTRAHEPPSHMQDSLQSCWFHVLGKEIISMSLELLLLPKHKYVHKNIKENTERTTNSLKGDPTSQRGIIWTLNKISNHKITHYFCCWLKQAKSMKFIVMLKKQLYNITHITGSCNIKDVWT